MTTEHMQAIVIEGFGGPQVLNLRSWPRPEPGPGEVLVRVHASGVNPTDWKHRQARRLLGDPPLILGWDVAGVVEDVGLGVAVLEPGDEVLGMLPYPGRGGAYAQYVAAPARTFVRKPQSISMATAAALPLAAVTAWQALVDVAHLERGQRILIHAAAGGVGHIAVQLASHLGAEVIGTASGRNLDLVREYGAVECIDYTTEDFAEVVKVNSLDVVLDTIGGDYGPRSVRTLRPGGVHVCLTPTLLAPSLADAAAGAGVATRVMLVEQDHHALKEMVRLVAEERVHVRVAKTYPIAEVGDAHAMGETNQVDGKLVLIWPEL